METPGYESISSKHRNIYKLNLTYRDTEKTMLSKAYIWVKVRCYWEHVKGHGAKNCGDIVKNACLTFEERKKIDKTKFQKCIFLTNS